MALGSGIQLSVVTLSAQKNMIALTVLHALTRYAAVLQATMDIIVILLVRNGRIVMDTMDVMPTATGDAILDGPGFQIVVSGFGLQLSLALQIRSVPQEVVQQAVSVSCRIVVALIITMDPIVTCIVCPLMIALDTILVMMMVSDELYGVETILVPLVSTIFIYVG